MLPNELQFIIVSHSLNSSTGGGGASKTTHILALHLLKYDDVTMGPNPYKDYRIIMV